MRCPRWDLEAPSRRQRTTRTAIEAHQGAASVGRDVDAAPVGADRHRARAHQPWSLVAGPAQRAPGVLEASSRRQRAARAAVEDRHGAAVRGRDIDVRAVRADRNSFGRIQPDRRVGAAEASAATVLKASCRRQPAERRRRRRCRGHDEQRRREQGAHNDARPSQLPSLGREEQAFTVPLDAVRARDGSRLVVMALG